MQRLKTLLRIIGLLQNRTGTCVQNSQRIVISNRQHSAVDFIECDPIMYFALIVFKQYRTVAQIEFDHSAVCPAIIVLRQCKGEFIMADRDQRLNTCCAQCVKYRVIKCKPCFIGLCIISMRKNSAPVDGHPVYFKSHFSHQGNIFLIVMIKVAGFMTWVKLLRLQDGRDLPWLCSAAFCQHVRSAGAFAIFVPAALKLIGCCGTAP